MRLSDHIRNNLVGAIALVIALCGTAYASGTIGSGDVIDNSLRSIDLKDGAGVKGVDVVPDSLTSADIKQSTLGTVPDTNEVGGIDLGGFVGKQDNPSGDFYGSFGDLKLLDGEVGTEYGIGSGAIVDSSLGRQDLSNGAAGAWGSVDGTSVGRSSRVQKVTNPSSGVFCITADSGINPANRGLVAIPNHHDDATATHGDPTDHPGSTTTAEWAPARSGGCPAGTFEVDTFRQFESYDVSSSVDAQFANFHSDASFFFIIP